MKIIGIMLENYTNLINSYLKVSTTEKKIFGEVFTPFSLVNEMLDLYDVDDWKNPNLTWFGPSAGIGNFQIKIVERLMEGLKEWEPNSEKRLKHILENQIYICEYQAKNLFLFLNIFDPENKYKLNYYCGSFLNEEFDIHMKNVWKIEKFDRIVENPPYNKENSGRNNKTTNIYHEFVIKSIKICDIVVMITPSRWFVMPNMKIFRHDMINDYGIKYIKHFNKNIFNSTSIDGGVSYFLLDKKSDNNIIYVDTDYNFKTQLLKKSLDKIILNKDIEVLNKILDKIKDFRKVSELYKNPQLIKSNDKRLKLQKNSNDDIEVLGSNNKKFFIDRNKINIDKFYIDKYKVSISRVNGGYKKTGISDIKIITNVLTTQSISFFPFDNINDAISFEKYLKTKFVWVLRDIYQQDKNFTSHVFEQIPMLPLYIDNDDDIFNFLDFDESMKNFINNCGKLNK